MIARSLRQYVKYWKKRATIVIADWRKVSLRKVRNGEVLTTFRVDQVSVLFLVLLEGCYAYGQLDLARIERLFVSFYGTRFLDYKLNASESFTARQEMVGRTFKCWIAE